MPVQEPRSNLEPHFSRLPMQVKRETLFMLLLRFTNLGQSKPLLERLSRVVVLAKVRPVLRRRVSHFLKGEPKISISEDKDANRRHPHELITLANTVISASISSSQAVDRMS